jgi:hypothetical protein
MRISSCLFSGNERCKIDLDGQSKDGVVREKQNSCLIHWLGHRQKNKRAELLAHGEWTLAVL